MANDPNLPAIPAPQDDFLKLLMEQRRLAALAESMLKFRKAAADSLDDCLVEMIRRNGNIGSWEFKTPNGRPCCLIVGVGEDISELLTKFVTKLINPKAKQDEEYPPTTDGNDG